MLSEDPLLDKVLEELANHVSTPNLTTLSIPAEAASQNNRNYSPFAPNQTPASSPVQPDLSLPEVSLDGSPSPPYSPTPPASQAPRYGADLSRSESPLIQAMLVDGDRDITNTPPAEQSTLNDNHSEPTADPEDANAEPNTAPMSTFLAVNEEYQDTLQTPSAQDPLSKYMRTLMPTVHEASPTAPWAFIPKPIISEWDSFPAFQLLALPFGFEARQHEKHNSLRKRILAAVVDITKSQRAGICPPTPIGKVIKARRSTPRAFLIHSLTKEEYFTLLKQKVWVSTEITFRVIITKPTCPDLLFTITELSSRNTEEVRKMVSTVWQKETTRSAIQDIVTSFTATMPQSPQPDIDAFLASLWVVYLEFRLPGGLLTPQFNIFAKGNFFQDHDMWIKVRGLLSRLLYSSNLLGGTGIPKAAIHHCNVCHGADHPRGMCPFLALDGWKGPSGFENPNLN